MRTFYVNIFIFVSLYAKVYFPGSDRTRIIFKHGLIYRLNRSNRYYYLRVMSMKGDTLHSLELEPHHQKQFCVIFKTSFLGVVVDEFYPLKRIAYC